MVNGSVRPRPSVWMATVDSSQRPSVGSAAQNARIPITSSSCNPRRQRRASFRAAGVQQMDEIRMGHNRIHIDVGVPHDQGEARVATALAAGGTLVSDQYAPMWWTLADPEGNEVDLATWIGRD